MTPATLLAHDVMAAMVELEWTARAKKNPQPWKGMVSVLAAKLRPRWGVDGRNISMTLDGEQKEVGFTVSVDGHRAQVYLCEGHFSVLPFEDGISIGDAPTSVRLEMGEKTQRKIGDEER
jgi:hypothetical protein